MQKIESTKKTKAYLVKPLKPSYCLGQDSDGEFWLGYSNPAFQGHIFRSFSTKQERSRAQLDKIEYAEYKIRFRPRRCEGLRNSWDDVTCALYFTQKCWKHNSKRRKQYYREQDL